MVNNFTANQIGDTFYAKLITPYENTTGINSWNISVGVTTPNTIGTISMTSGDYTVVGQGTNFNFVTGDTFIVGNTEFEVGAIIDANTFAVVVPPIFTGTGLKFYKSTDANNFFDYEFKWSQESLDSDGGIMSEYQTLNNNTNTSDLLGLVFDPLKPVWITVQIVQIHMQ